LLFLPLIDLYPLPLPIAQAANDGADVHSLFTANVSARNR
jgi:hypothetical protein